MSKDKQPVPLEVMLGTEVEFEAKGKKYYMSPIAAAHIPQFRKEGVFFGDNQFFNLYEEKSNKIINKWLGGEVVTAKILDVDVSATYLHDANKNPMSLERTMADGWDVVDYKRYFTKMCDISG